ncbi:MAG TPA: S8 family serine peptidase, partial [Pedobacter sp.]|nr:S8 family serine peptidase [Pedobacter sp.]
MTSHSIKKLIAFSFLSALPFFAIAQKPNWQNLDLKTDTTFGISTEKAYKELLKGKKSTPVLVAVLDGGVDLNHEDLKRVIWTNKKEVAGNGIDDDKNGYKDDLHGWNFLGGPTGSIEHETLELTRLVRRDNIRFAGLTAETVPAKDKADYDAFIKNRTKFEQDLVTARSNYAGVSGFKSALDPVIKKIGKENPTLSDLEGFQPQGERETRVKEALKDILKDMDFKTFYETQILEGVKYYGDQINFNYNVDFDPRNIVGDNPNDVKEHFYGNNDIKGPDALHGSHVAGIIGGDRTNSLG